MRKLNRNILKLALPSILANITVPLVGMVDIAVVGHLGTQAVRDGLTTAALIGGISIGSMLFDLLYWNFAFLRSGTGGLAAQAFGRYRKAEEMGDGIARDKALRDSADVFSRALFISIFAGFFLIMVQWLILQAVFLVVDCSPEVRLLAERYFEIRIWAAPATLSLFAFKGWFIGMQDTVSAMASDLIVNGVNILLSITLAFAAGMGFDGVALGTVIAQWTGFFFSAGVVFVKYRPMVFTDYRLQDAVHAVRVDTKGFFSMNADLMVRSLGMIAVYIGFTVLSARFGDALLAASTILMKLLMIFSYFTDGFAYAGEALTGKFIGMRDPEMVRRTIRATFAWSMSIVGGFMVLYGLLGVPMVRMMTSDEAVVEACRPFLPWLLLMPLIGCPAFTWDGIFIGATRTRPMRDCSLAAAAGFFLTWVLLTKLAGPLDGNLPVHYLMAAYFVHLLVRTLWLTATSGRIYSETGIGRPLQ